MSKSHRPLLATLALALAPAAACDSGGPEVKHSAVEHPPTTEAAQIERGRYLVSAAGCNDCHTPLMMGPEGPRPDTSRLLSGHPEALIMPPAPELPPGPWIATVGATMTAWSGPWGTTFTANLTPDPDTGLGRWTTQNFIDTIRTGRHMGKGRPLLPPMPVEVIANFTDEDLAAMFAYLQSLPPIENRVPEPLPPPAAPTGAAGAPPAGSAG